MIPVRITGSGQVTIPAEIRRKHGLKAGDQVLWGEDEEGRIIVKPIQYQLEDLVGIFPLLPGVQTDGDFDDLIDEAFEEGYAREWDERSKQDQP